MNMKWLLIEITETVEELKAIMHSQVKAKLKERVHALYVWKAGIVKDIADLASLLGRSESTIRLWFARYQAEGLSGLLAWHYRGGKRPALSGTVLEALQARLQEPDGFRSYGEIRDWLAKEQGLEIPYKTVHQTVRYKLKAKLKVARPTHRLRAEMAVVDFKKKLPERLKIIDVFQSVDDQKPKPIRYWCQDESRFGLKTLTYRVITALGIKPRGLVQWPFEALYTYGAVEPITGESFFLLFSHLDSDCFQLFLNEFAAAYPASLNVVQLDNGAFHKAKKLEIPENVVLLFQPAYSPDVNPIERVWQYLKKQDSWLNFETLADLQTNLCQKLNTICRETIASLAGYPFILSALENLNL